MPAIRDAVFAQEALTTDGGLTIPMCDYDTGDLLFAFLIGDTGAPVLGCSNGVGTWTQLFQQTNTSLFACYWKYAAASGEGNVVFTSTVTETYCGYLVSIRDVFQGHTPALPPTKNNVAQAAANKFQLPTITTTTPDSLILTAVSSSTLNPSMVMCENNVHTQTMINGTAEGGSLGWFIQRSAGVTPSNINVGAAATGVGVNAIIEVKAPIGGATVIPAYAASDDSVLLSINPGVAYNGSTALAATADTNFGTSLGGIVVNDGVIATAVVDQGVDDKGFLASAGLTNVASATAISGAEVVMPVASYNIGNSNILAHVRSVTTVAAQNLGALGTTRGVWLGCRSGTTAGTNYKIWQVHGTDAPYPGNSVVPVVINPGNIDSRTLAGTHNNTDNRAFGFWQSGAGALTGQLILGPIWKMGTTVVAGGSISEPINITGINFATAKGKLRWSSIRQGLNQLLCLQAVQFGDGGTNQIKLLLESTAIEFPSKRNLDNKTVNYNGIDNIIGFTYNAGVMDSIIHRGSVISSPSKYHWRIHPSSSALATYDFSALTIIGSGDVVLRDVTTFTQMTFDRCDSVQQNSAAINDCVFKSATSTALISNNPNKITNCSFTSNGTGHAIEITTPGTYSFSSNLFTGYGAAATTNAAVYNNSGGVVILNIVNGGDTPTIRNGTGASTTVNNAVTIELTGLIAGSRIYIRNTTDGVDLFNQIEATTTFNQSINFTGNKSLLIRIRNASDIPKYKAFETTGTLTSIGFSAVINQIVDE